MRKFILLFLFCFPSTLLSQDENATPKFLYDVLHAYAVPASGDLKIFPGLITIEFEKWLNHFAHSKQRTFKSNTDPNQSITLTDSEVAYITKTIRENYAAKWESKDFKIHKILGTEDTRGYLSNPTNTLIMISHPAFIRNNEIAACYFGMSSLGNIANIRYDYCFYKKDKGLWRKWIIINSK